MVSLEIRDQQTLEIPDCNVLVKRGVERVINIKSLVHNVPGRVAEI